MPKGALMRPKIDGLSIAALAILIFLGANLLNDTSPASGARLGSLPAAQAPASQSSLPTPDPEAFAAPYTSFTLTQGPHGASYGHLAIDLAAGEGTPILSPINAVVADLFMDEWGNPTLILENDTYEVTLMHGNFTVSVGQTVSLGEQIGSESNRGYTTDMAGNPCWERPGCGYHTHLNVFDKTLGENVNPLELLRE
jgi:murein DD-endopeptidase MepM/ murein hydrolase activator NlpD